MTHSARRYRSFGWPQKCGNVNSPQEMVHIIPLAKTFAQQGIMQLALNIFVQMAVADALL